MKDFDAHAGDALLSPVAGDAAVEIAAVAKAFARNVRRRREAIGVSQHLVATILWRYGFSTWRQTTLAKIEAGRRAVKLDEAFALAALYEISVDDLLRDRGVETVDAEAVTKRLLRRGHPMWGHAGGVDDGE